MSHTLPTNIHDFMDWSWPQIEPFYQELLDCPLDAANVSQWLLDWTRLIDLTSELHARLHVAITSDTTDKDAEERYNAFLDGIYPASQAANQDLKEKLLASGLAPEGLDVPLRRMRAEAAIFRAENLPLLSEEHKLSSQYNKIIGAQTVQWEGEELTLQQMRKVYETPERAVRERAWRLAAERQLADRQGLNELWTQFMGLRQQLATNAGLADYRAYRWQQLLRLDYTPRDCMWFREAIEQVVVPAATRLYKRYRRALKVDALRPWDLDLDIYPIHLPPLPPYGSTVDLQDRAEAIFGQVDAQLGEYFHTMHTEGLLDLDNRKGKAPGGYCTGFQVTRRPFIFMNAVGLVSDIRTVLHESGHAFHNFERFCLPYAQQRIPGLEFSEVASMAMELLTLPYLTKERGGFYSEADAQRYRLDQLERILVFWPYMAVVDAFQHWVYAHPDLATDARRCDAQWMELWQRFLPGVDWSGLETEAMTGWHRKQHIFRAPFYYVEYGLAQLGAVQVWKKAMQDPAQALKSYRYALSLGGTVSLPELYNAAGVRLAFDAETLEDAVQLIEGFLA